MKFTRILFTTLTIIAGLIGLFIIYFAGQVSAVYDPLKSYSYSLTKDELKERLIETIKSKPNLTFSLTDSTGTDKCDLNYYGDLLVKVGTEEYEYNIKYNKRTVFGTKKSNLKFLLLERLTKCTGREDINPRTRTLKN